MGRTTAEDPAHGRVMSEDGEVSFVSAKAAGDAAKAKEGDGKDGSKPKKPQKTWAQMKAERDALDQEIAREIAELGAMPKALRRARVLLDKFIVYGIAIIVAATLYAIASIVWPPKTDDEVTIDVGVNEMVDEEVGSMMDARRRLMKGQQRTKKKEDVAEEGTSE